MRMSRRGDLNAPSIEYFLLKDDDRGMPRERRDSRSYDSRTDKAAVYCIIILPSDNMCGHGYDPAIAEIIYV